MAGAGAGAGTGTGLKWDEAADEWQGIDLDQTIGRNCV